MRVGGNGADFTFRWFFGIVYKRCILRICTGLDKEEK